MTIRLLLVSLGLVLLAGCSSSTSAPASSTSDPAAPTNVNSAPAPTRVTIPAIGMDSTLIRTGMLPDGSPEVPDVRDPGQASWATWSPEPGSIGPAVLLGHVDGVVNGKRGVLGVFARIRTLRPGQLIEVDRVDGTRITFTVDRVETVPKASLELTSGDTTARRIYGDVSRAELRLITCGGSFDHTARSYRDQVVVFAHAGP